MKAERSSWRIEPIQLRERARLYRFAAVLANSPGEIAMFRDLAISFEQLARQLGQAEGRSSTARARPVGMGSEQMLGTDC
jgi:hypothetical protein